MILNYYICETCGVQYGQSKEEPHHCKICEDDRQYISENGQKWTTLEELTASGEYNNQFNVEEEGLFSIKTSPDFAIGQAAYYIQGENFKMLWDCITYLDETTITLINELGGIDAIALSHPHYYSTQVEWAEAFNAPIYIHEDDREWVTRPSERIVFWAGETHELHEGFVLHRVGGHFKGATVLEWKKGDHGNGVLLVGDSFQVADDQDWVSFMYSYPNFLPLPADTVQRIADQVKEIRFEKIYDAFLKGVQENASQSVQKSAQRHIKALKGELFDT